MKTFLKTLLLFTGIIFFTGGACPSNDTTASNKVAQSEIYQSYTVDQEGANYEVTAFFRIGGKTGTTLALSAPSKVTFNGQPMKEHLNTNAGTYYSINVPASTAVGVFAFTDQNSKVYTNKIGLAKASLTQTKLVVNGSGPVAIPIAGNIPEVANFNLNVNSRMVIVSPSNGDMAEAYFDKTSGSVVILPLAWERAENGNVSIDLAVRDEIPTQQGTALGGDMAFAYESAPVNATLTKARSVGKKPSTKNATAKR